MVVLGSTPEETWCVGDNFEWEIAGPQRLGIHTVCQSVQRRAPAGTDIVPDRITRSIAELL